MSPTNNTPPTEPDAQQPSSEGLDDAICSPSDFLKAPFPSCSYFSEAWHEMAAQAFMHALVSHGDKWQKLTPQQVQDCCKSSGFYYGSTLDHDRMQRVMDKLTCPEDAKAFSWAWSNVTNETSGATEKKESQ
jgi:hypothetical protein